MPVGIRRLLSVGVVSLCALVGGLVFGGAPALAAGLEKPEALTPTEVRAETATLQGILSPKIPGEVGSTYEFFDNASTTKVCTGGSATTPVVSIMGLEAEPVSEPVTALKPDTEYAVCLVVDNAAKTETATSLPVTFTTLPAAPAITSESASSVESTEATLNAQIDPNGAATSYRFEYGTTEAYGQSTPETALTGLTGTETASARITTGLQPAITYHYRVTAVNEVVGKTETVHAPDKTFTTSPAPGSEPPTSCPNAQRREEQPYALKLPDCRAYEMVSPVNTEGQDATDSFVASVARAAVSGEAVTYASKGNFGSPTGGDRENHFLSRRGSEGWSTQAITPPRVAQKLEQLSSYESMAFTPELTEGIADTNYSLTGEGPENEDGRVAGLYVANFADGAYRYVTEGFWPMGSSTDLSHVVVSGQSQAFPAGEPTFVSEWVDGRMTPVSVTNTGENIEAVVGEGAPGLEYPKSAHHTWRAVSTDGSRVYFTGVQLYTADGFTGLYVRVNAEQPQSHMRVVNGKEECEAPTDACTIEVSASQRTIADPHGPQAAYYQSASTDGSKVFFTSTAELTEDAYTGPADNAANLYEYDLDRPVGERLKDLTVDRADTDGAAVQEVVQVSEDGSYVYFVADGDLAAGATAGEPNLYVLRDGGAPTFIAATPASSARGRSVVSPNGSRLAFLSGRSLTGYDNEQAQEIYLYDAEAKGIVCASCNPSGARPVGEASFFPESEGGSGTFNAFAESDPRNLLENGTLFFDSGDALVPHASDGRVNVYEYEDGHVYPISDVAGGYESFFMDASADGDNVFFGTADQLLAQDTSNNVVVYDARVNGGFPVSVAPPSCDNGDSCKPPPAPQPGVFGAPGSATFSGPGNITPAVTVTPVVKAKAKSMKCKKGYEKKKDKCVKKIKKKAKKSSDHKGSK